jgi:hypothetical protein
MTTSQLGTKLGQCVFALKILLGPYYRMPQSGSAMVSYLYTSQATSQSIVRAIRVGSTHKRRHRDSSMLPKSYRCVCHGPDPNIDLVCECGEAL